MSTPIYPIDAFCEIWRKAAIGFMFAVCILGVVHAQPIELKFFPTQFPAPEPEPPVAELERMYKDDISGNFADVVPELARRFKPLPPGMPSLGTHPAEWVEKPWKGGLRYILGAAWWYHTNYGERNKERGGEDFETLMRIVGDKSIGLGRQMALQEVSVRLNYGQGDPSMPAYAEVMARLGKVASDPTEDLELRSWVVPVLFQHGDPNDWLDTAMTLSDGETDAAKKGEMFRRLAPSLYSGKLSAANRARYLNYAFSLLEAMDDNQGTGYFLAEEIGQVISISLGRKDSGLFRPTVDRPEFHDGNSLSKAFFQSPVDNARAWWQKHRTEYATAAVVGEKSLHGLRPPKPRQGEVPDHMDEGKPSYTSGNSQSVIWILLFILGTRIALHRFLGDFRNA